MFLKRFPLCEHDRDFIAMALLTLSLSTLWRLSNANTGLVSWILGVAILFDTPDFPMLSNFLSSLKEVHVFKGSDIAENQSIHFH